MVAVALCAASAHAQMCVSPICSPEAAPHGVGEAVTHSRATLMPLGGQGWLWQARSKMKVLVPVS